MNIRSTEAKQRAEAAVLADEIIGRMWVAQAVQREDFAHRADAQCNAANPATPQALLTSWMNKLQATIPGAQASISHVEATGETVWLTVCWPRPQTNEWSNRRPRPHQFEQLTPRGMLARPRVGQPAPWPLRTRHQP